MTENIDVLFNHIGDACGQHRFGVVTFADLADPLCATARSEALMDAVSEAVFAERCGIDFFHVGEHHMSSFAINAPEVLLAFIAARTTRIGLGTALTVLPLDDPIRLMERCATLATLSGHRAEIMIGKGAFPDDYQLFSVSFRDRDALFTEKFAHLMRIRNAAQVPGSDVIPIQIGTGGNLETAVLAVDNATSLVVTVLSEQFSDYVSFSSLYHLLAQEELGYYLPLGAFAIGHIADTDERAVAEFYPCYQQHYAAFAQQYHSDVMTEEQFMRRIADTGSLLVGSVETVVQKIVSMIVMLNIRDVYLRYSMPGLTAEQRLRCLELYGTQVIPRVRDILG